MDGLTVVTLSALVWKVVELVKNAVKQRWDPVLTQAVVWFAGVIVALIAGAAKVTEDIEIWGHTLGTLDNWSLVLVGLALGSFSGVGYEVKKALDNQDSAAQPTLLDPEPGPAR